jgi:LacI family transcriptional regulator
MEEDLAAARALQGTVPVVSLHDVAGGEVATVGSDHELTGVLATRHLIDRGHRVIATIIGIPGRRVTEGRLRGYRRALEEAGLAFDETLVSEGQGETGGAQLATVRLLEGRPDITAIFAQNDAMAIGVLSALRKLGKQVPEGCAVAGCDDIDMAAYTVPALTTVHVPFYETGTEAMRLLLNMIGDGAAPRRNVLLPVQLVIRAST